MPIRPSLHDLSIRQLEYIVAVAETGGFHRAAVRCGVSQPALSEQVQLLESLLGVVLFERDRRSVRITTAGEIVVNRARRVLVETGDLIDVAVRARDPFDGVMRVGVIPTIAPYFLPEVTPLLAKKYPRLRIVYREQMTELVVADLASGDLDCGIVALEADLGDLAHAVLFTDPFVVALPKHHPLARKKRLHLHDLDSARVLLLEDGHCFRTQALALCAKTSAREAEFRATSLGTLVQMVTSSFAITLLPALALKVENRRAQLEIRPIIAPIPKRTIALVWRRTSPLSAALKEIAAAIHSAVA